VIYRVPAPDEKAILQERAQRELRDGLRRERQRFYVSLALFVGVFVLAGASIGAWIAFDVLASR
jgi:hypothetical protein